MKVEIQELDPCKRQLVVEAPEEEVRAAWTAACGRVQRDARLPGFRRGKVPMTLVRSRFGDEVRQAVAEALIPVVYRRAVDETQIRPVEDPEFRELQLEEGQPLRFTAVVEIKPAIALGAYTGLGVTHAPKPLGEEEVDEAINHFREQHAEFRAVERTADLGDLVIMDYTLTPEGMDAREEKDYSFLLGQGSVLPEIEEAVIGLAAGASRTIRLKFAEDHRNEALRGKSGEATVMVKEVKEKILPALDDEFAKGMGAFETLDALKEALRKDLQARRDRENRNGLEDAVVEALLASHDFQVPESLVLRQVGHQIEHTRERLRRQGVNPDQLPWDYKKLLEDLKPGAEKAVKRALILEAIAEKEGLAPGEEQVDAEVERIAQASQRPAPAVKRMMEQSGDLDSLRYSLREARTLDFLIEKAQITA